MIATNSGLFIKDVSKGDLRLLSSKKYLQMDYLEHLGILLSRETGENMIKIRSILQNDWTKLLQKTADRKMLGRPIRATEGCTGYSVYASVGTAYIAVHLPTGILLLEWAPDTQAFFRFKEINYDISTVRSIDVIEPFTLQPKLCLSLGTGPVIIDMVCATEEEVSFEAPNDQDLIACLQYGPDQCFCYENYAFIVNSKRTISWTDRICAAAKVGGDLLAVCSKVKSSMDIIQLGNGKVIYSFCLKHLNDLKEMRLIAGSSGSLLLLTTDERATTVYEVSMS